MKKRITMSLKCYHPSLASKSDWQTGIHWMKNRIFRIDNIPSFFLLGKILDLITKESILTHFFFILLAVFLPTAFAEEMVIGLYGVGPGDEKTYRRSKRLVLTRFIPACRMQIGHHSSMPAPSRRSVLSFPQVQGPATSYPLSLKPVLTPLCSLGIWSTSPTTTTTHQNELPAWLPSYALRVHGFPSPWS